MKEAAKGKRQYRRLKKLDPWDILDIQTCKVKMEVKDMWEDVEMSQLKVLDRAYYIDYNPDGTQKKVQDVFMVTNEMYKRESDGMEAIDVTYDM